MRPNDPNYVDQWFFRLIGDIETVWDDYTGSGVNVGIYDSGVDRNNVDLSGNYNAGLHITYNGVTYDGTPNDSSDYDQSHGTAVAGLIGASGNNSTGVVGVAWGSSLTGVNVFDSTSPLYLRGSNLDGFLSALHQMVNFDVVNNSWNNTPKYENSQRFIDELREFKYANDFGRGGLGTIIVQSAGNDDWDASGSLRNVSRYTVTISATYDTGFVTSYSNFGNSILVAAPGGNANIVTTDRSGDDGYNDANNGSFDNSGNYTSGFDGTSAAAPIVSGIVALMLEANPNLGWRDVQEILSISAVRTGSAIGSTEQIGEEFGNWRVTSGNDWNGGGRHTHLSYGYGMVNAFNAVRMAEAWSYFSPVAQTSQNEALARSTILPTNGAINDNTTTSFNFNISQNVVMEHVDIALTLSHTYPADLTISLTSPDGRTSFLGDLRPMGETDISNYTYTFALDNLRGVQSVGTWTLNIKDRTAQDVGTLHAIDFNAYGHTPSINNVYHYTDEFGMMAEFGGRGFLHDTNGGTDWIDAASMTTDLWIDLGTGTATIDEYGVSVAGIENIVGGSGNDVLTGNGDANTLIGGRGQDVFEGGGGSDRLIGGRDGDSYLVESADDVVIEKPGEGSDWIISDVNYALAAGQEIEGLVSGHVNAKNALILTGNAFGQQLDGNYGDNILDGRGGADKLRGFLGNDLYYVDNAGDTIESEEANQGDDRVITSISYRLSAGAEIEKLQVSNASSTRSLNLTGNEFGQTIMGNDGDNVLDGQAGADILRGFHGNDTYYVDSADDLIEYEKDGWGSDTVFAYADHKLGTDEEIELLAVARVRRRIMDVDLAGNGFSQTLRGNSASNQLQGRGGDDILIGGAGIDALYGGKGKDTFAFRDVSELGEVRNETDTIYDFSRRQRDRIDLSGIDADSNAAGRQAFSFIGKKDFSSTAGELQFSTDTQGTFVYGDIDGDGKIDFALHLADSVRLGAADFVL